MSQTSQFAHKYNEVTVKELLVSWFRERLPLQLIWSPTTVTRNSRPAVRIVPEIEVARSI